MYLVKIGNYAIFDRKNPRKTGIKSQSLVFFNYLLVLTDSYIVHMGRGLKY